MFVASSPSTLRNSLTATRPAHVAAVRHVSSSPYGRTHVWRRRPPTLPNPVVPQFPQVVTLVDGSTYTHWTTSPRSSMRLTRDTTNNPVWNPWLAASSSEDLEGKTTGRLGRFDRRFENMGGKGMDMSWLDTSMEGSEQPLVPTDTIEATETVAKEKSVKKTKK